MNTQKQWLTKILFSAALLMAVSTPVVAQERGRDDDKDRGQIQQRQDDRREMSQDQGVFQRDHQAPPAWGRTENRDRDQHQPRQEDRREARRREGELRRNEDRGFPQERGQAEDRADQHRRSDEGQRQLTRP